MNQGDAPRTAFEQLNSLIDTRQALVGVIGLGYVGLPLAHTFVEAGMRVLGLDVDGSKLECLAEGRNYLPHLGDAMCRDLGQSDAFEGSTDFRRLAEADAILICVPTPLGQHQEPDLSYIMNTARDVGAALRPGQLIILGSTTFPGTTREHLLAGILRAVPDTAGPLVCGQDFFVAFSPEREDPGRDTHDTRSTPRLVGGLDTASTQLAARLYRHAIDEVIEVSSAEVAEAAKLHENVFRAVNVALVNELKVVLSDLGVDVWEVIAAASTKPFGFMPFYPGPGLGGHCVPIDPFYLTWKAKETNRDVRFIELAGTVNTDMPRYVVERVSHALNRYGKPVNGSRILLLGLAYKANVADTRESPGYELIQRLRELGAEVDYSDPHVARATPVRKYEVWLESVALSADVVAGYDAVLISTAHDCVDWGLVARHCQLVIDTRNAMAPFARELGDRLVKA